jgi:hypothetical protein
MQTCQGKTRTGTPCRAPAGPGGLCFFHANPDSARTLGQVGGRKNRRSAVDLEVPENMTAADVTGQAIRLLLAGKLRAREASALAQLCNSLYRIIPTADLEARVTMLEEQVVQKESGTSPDCDSSESPQDGSEAAESDVRRRAEQQSLDLIDETAHDNNVAESESDEPIEGEEP